MMPLYGVVGPTASGKTALAVALAEHIDGEIVSVDSAQIFIGLDIGTAKPSAQEQARVRHHLIDLLPPTQQWTAADYAQAADRAISDIVARGKVPILCGGTGLWMRALVRGIFAAPTIDPEIRAQVRRELLAHGSEAMHAILAQVDPVAAAKIQPRDPQRIGRALEVYRQGGVPISTLQAAHGFAQPRYAFSAVAPDWPREQLIARIHLRAAQMYQGGLVEETAACLARGVPDDAPGLSIIGYRDAVRCVRGAITRADAEAATAIATRQYAKRQRNWFQSEPEVAWIAPEASAAAVWQELRARWATLYASAG